MSNLTCLQVNFRSSPPNLLSSDFALPVVSNGICLFAQVRKYKHLWPFLSVTPHPINQPILLFYLQNINPVNQSFKKYLWEETQLTILKCNLSITSCPSSYGFLGHIMNLKTTCICHLKLLFWVSFSEHTKQKKIKVWFNPSFFINIFLHRC